jgi:hypothetical protein
MGPYSFEFPEQGWHLEIANSIYNVTATNLEFVEAIKYRFSTIDVKKTQSLVKRGRLTKRHSTSTTKSKSSPMIQLLLCGVR